MKNYFCLKQTGLLDQQNSSKSLAVLSMSYNQAKKTFFQRNKEICLTLRGGGGCCGSNKTTHQFTSSSSPKIIPQCFYSNFQKFSSTLINTIPIDGNDPDVLITFQWFIHNEQNFWIIASNQQLASIYYYPCLEKFEQILNILPKYLRVSGYLFYLLLKICNILLQVIAKFQAHNEKRLIEHEKQETYKIQIKDIETQIEIESNRIWELGVNFELQLIKTVVTHLRTNSTQKQDILFSFITGLASSFAAFQITEELKQSIKDGAKLIATIIYEEQIQNPLQIYKIYQYFQELKWQILLSIRGKQSIYLMLDYLKESYQNHIQYSKNWVMHYQWIEIISSVVTYRPIIAREEFNKEEWNNLLRTNKIICLPYSQNEGMLNIDLESEVQELNPEVEKRLKIDYFEFIVFKKSLLDMSQQNNKELMLWNQYFDFEFKKKTSKTNYEEKELVSGLLKNDENFNNYFLTYFQQKIKSIEATFDQKNKIVEWQKKSQKKIYHDFNNIFDKLTEHLLDLLFLINEFTQYFTFQMEKYQLFMQNQQIESKQEQVISYIKDVQIKHQKYQQTTWPNFFHDWQNLLDQFATQRINIILSDSQNSIDDIKNFTEKINNLKNLLIFCEDINNCFDKIQGESQNLQKIQFTINHSQLDQCINGFSKLFSNSTITIFLKWVQEDFQQNSSYSWGSDKETEFQSNLQNCYKFSVQISVLCEILFVFFLKNKLLKNNLKGLLNSIENESLNKNEFLQLDQFKKIIEQQKQRFQEIISLQNNENIQTQNIQMKQLIQSIEMIQSSFNFSQMNNDNGSNLSQILLIILNQLRLLLTSREEKKNKLNKEITYNFDSLIEQIESFSKPTEQIIQEEKKKFSFDKIMKKNQFILLKEHSQELNKLFIDWQIIFQLLLDQKLTNKRIENIILMNQELHFDRKNTLEKIINQLNELMSQDFYPNQLDQHSKQLYLKYIIGYNYFKQQYKISYQSDEQRQLSYLKFLMSFSNQVINKNEKKKNILYSLFEDQGYKVRECLLFNLLQIQSIIFEPKIQQFVQNLIKSIWLTENNQNVKSLLQNQEIIDMQKRLFNYNLKTFADQIKADTLKLMLEIEQIEYEARIEGKTNKGVDLENKLNEKYEQFEQYFDNLSEMSDKLGLNFLFLKDIAKEIKIIKNKIDKLAETVDIIGNDVRKLRGKTCLQLLELRKNNVLASKKLRDLDSVYVAVQTQELHSKTGEIVKTQKGSSISFLFKSEYRDFEGEVNEFLWKTDSLKQDVLLIKGQAGSGKSRAAKMIEEFIFLQNDKQNSEKWIPIFISLPQLKDPKNNLIFEGLESENYQFDNIQIRELIEFVQKGEMKLLLILDSYDEMRSENIESNLYQTNKLDEEFSIKEIGQQVKLIITVRTEILKQSNYQSLFCGQSLESLKIVELLPFNKQQAKEFLRQFSVLNVKRKIKNLFEYIRLIKGKQFNLNDFQQLWEFIFNAIPKLKNEIYGQNIEEDLINKQDKSNKQKQYFQIEQNILQDKDELERNQLFIYQFSEQEEIFESEKLEKLEKSVEKEIYTQSGQQIFTNTEIQQIIKILKKNKEFEKINDQQFVGLQKELNKEWSQQRFSETISNMKIEHLLTTPFMLEIIAQVLPKLSEQFSENTLIKEMFCQNFMTLKKAKILSEQIKQHYQQSQNKIQVKTLDEIKYGQNYSSVLAGKHLDQILTKFENFKFFQSYTISEPLIVDNENIFCQDQKIFLGDDLNLILKCLKTNKITIYQFYKGFCSLYSETQLQKWKNLGKISNSESLMIDFEEFQESFALDMTIRQLTQVKCLPKGKLKIIKAQIQSEQEICWQDQYFGNVEDINYRKIMMSCILISTNGSTYQFNHKSIQEYFVGKYIINLLEQIRLFQIKNKQNFNQEIEKFMDNQLFNKPVFNISEDHFQGTLKLIKDHMSNFPDIIEILLIITLLSKNLKFIRASSNSIFLKSYLQVFVKFQDLSGINIFDTKIKGLSFNNCNLRNSQFQNVNIDSCGLLFSDLRNINWQNIHYNEMKVLKNHASSISAITFSQNNNNEIIASGDCEGIVILWNANTLNVILKQKIVNQEIKYLMFSQNQNYFIVATISNFIIFNIENGIIIQTIGDYQLQQSIKSISLKDNDKILEVIGIESIQKWDFNKISNFNIKQMINCEKLLKITCLAYSPDYKKLFIANEHGKLYAFEQKNKNEVIHIQTPHSGDIIKIEFLQPDDNLVTIGKDQMIIIWEQIEQPNRKQILVLKIKTYDFKKICFFKKESILCMIFNDNKIYKLEVNQRKEINNLLEIEGKEFSQDKINLIRTNQQGNLIAVVSEQDILLIYSIKKLEITQIEKMVLQSFKPGSNIIFLNNSLIAICYLNQYTEIINFQNHLSIRKIKYDNTQVSLQSCALSSETNQFGLYLSNGQIIIHNFETSVQSVFNSGDKNENREKFSDYNDFQFQQKFQPMGFSKNGIFLALYNSNNYLFLFNLKKVQRILRQQISKPLLQIQFLFDDELILISDENSIQLVSFFYDSQKESLESIKINNLFFSRETFSTQIHQMQNQQDVVFILKNQIQIWQKQINTNEQNIQNQKTKFNIQLTRVFSHNYFNLILLEDFQMIVQRSQKEIQKFYLSEMKLLINMNNQLDILGSHSQIIKDIVLEIKQQNLISLDEQEVVIWNVKNNQKIHQTNFGGQMYSFIFNNEKLVINDYFGQKIRVIDFQNKYEVEIFEISNSDVKITNQIDSESQIHPSNNGFFVIIFSQQKDICEIQQWEAQNYGKFEFKLIKKLHINLQNKKFILLNPVELQITFYQTEIKVIEFQNIEYSACNQISLREKCYKDIINFEEINIIAYKNKIVVVSQQFDGNRFHEENHFKCLLLQFISQKKQLIIGNEDGQLDIYNYAQFIQIQDKKQIPTLYHSFNTNKKLNAMKLQKNGIILISAHIGDIFIWDVDQKQKISFFQAHEQQINVLHFSPDEKVFLTGCQDHSIKIWSLKSCCQIQTDQSHQKSIERIYFSKDGLHLLTHSQENSILYFDMVKMNISQRKEQIKQIQLFDQKLMIQLDSNFKLTHFLENSTLVSLEFLNTFEQNFPCGIKFKQTSFKLFNNGNDLLTTVVNDSEDPFHYFTLKNYPLHINDIYLKFWSTRQDYEIKDDEIFIWGFKSISIINIASRKQSGQINLTFEICDMILFEKKIFFLLKDSNILKTYNYQTISNSYIEESEHALKGHQDFVQKILIFKNEMMSFDKQGTFIIWSLKDLNREIKQINLRQQFINVELCNVISLSQTDYIAIGNLKGEILILQFDDEFNFKKVKNIIIPTKNKLQQIEFFYQEDILACFSDEFLWFINYKNIESNKILRSTYKCYHQFRINPKDNMIFYIDRENYIRADRIFESFDYTQLQIGQDAIIGGRLLTNKSKNFIYYNQDQSLKLFNFKNKKSVIISKSESIPNKIKISNNNSILASIDFQNTLKIYIKQGEQYKELKEIQNLKILDVTLIDFINDQIIMVGYTDSLVYYSIDQKIQLFKLRFHQSVRSFASSPNNQIFAVGLSDGSLFFYTFNMNNLDPISQFHDNNFKLDFSKMPICFKMFQNNSNLLAGGCIINNNTIIQSTQGLDLKKILIEKNAILQND